MVIGYGSRKCPSCKSNGLEYKESRSVTCPVCGWTTVADWNYVDMLGARGEYETLAEAYAALFERMERGQFGDSKCYYSKTQEEEFAEFLDEARLSIDQLMGLRILDAGCGAARLTRMLSICGAECVALDIHQRLYIYGFCAKGTLSFGIHRSYRRAEFGTGQISMFKGIISHVAKTP